MGMHYCVMLGLYAASAARHILDPREQVSTFAPLGALPVTDRHTFPEFGLGVLLIKKVYFFQHFPSSIKVGIMEEGYKRDKLHNTQIDLV